MAHGGFAAIQVRDEEPEKIPIFSVRERPKGPPTPSATQPVHDARMPLGGNAVVMVNCQGASGDIYAENCDGYTLVVKNSGVIGGNIDAVDSGGAVLALDGSQVDADRITARRHGES